MFKNYYSSIKESLPKIFGDKAEFLASVKTYGCQQNFADSEKICGILKRCGFSFTFDEKKADLIVFNTCAIREHAENRFLGNLGSIKKIKENNRNLMVVVCGCISQQEKVARKIKDTFPFVNLVLGTDYFDLFPELLCQYMCNRKNICVNELRNVINIVENVPVRRSSKIKASVSIMYGCNNFCSYCIVPYVRGRERSRNPQSILDEVESLINKGYKEILLLGQNVNSYGKGITENINFSELLSRIDKIDGEYWIRFMTSHPKDITKELIDNIKSSKHIPASIHLPVQSGNNRILEKMNRKYTVDRYLEIISYIKNKLPKVCLSTDIIVGFPGESEREFLDTVDLVKKVRYSLVYSFIFSKRSGTPAAKMEDFVPYEEKTRRLNYLLEVQKEISDEIFESFVKTEQKVLIETFDKKSGVFLGRTEGNILVKISSNKKDILGSFLLLKISGSTRTYLTANF